MGKKPTLLSVKNISEPNPYLHLWESTYSNGAKWYTASRDKQYAQALENPGKARAKGVHIVLFNKDFTKILVTKEFRYTVNDYVYQTPAGILEEHLGVEGTALLELKEETGYSNVEHIKTTPALMSSTGMSDECSSVYFARLTKDSVAGEQELGEDEVIDYEWLSQEEITALADEGKYMSAILYMASMMLVRKE